VQLLAHAVVVGVGLAALIAMIQPVSGAHFNPSVTLGFWRTRAITGTEAIRYAAAQLLGGVAGVLAANWSFGNPMATISRTARGGSGLAFAEAVATFVLVLLILGLVRTDRTSAIPAAVGAWGATVVFATSSTGFANPAVTLSRILTDSYTGIAPVSVPGFLIAQIVAGLLAAGSAAYLYPKRPSEIAATQEA
jgi:glycerol uptake facilitator-like aquaporin